MMQKYAWKEITDLCRFNNHNKRKHNDIIQLCMLYLDGIMQIWIKHLMEGCSCLLYIVY